VSEKTTTQPFDYLLTTPPTPPIAYVTIQFLFTTASDPFFHGELCRTSFMRAVKTTRDSLPHFPIFGRELSESRRIVTTNCFFLFGFTPPRGVRPLTVSLVYFHQNPFLETVKYRPFFTCFLNPPPYQSFFGPSLFGDSQFFLPQNLTCVNDGTFLRAGGSGASPRGFLKGKVSTMRQGGRLNKSKKMALFVLCLRPTGVLFFIIFAWKVHLCNAVHRIRFLPVTFPRP